MPDVIVTIDARAKCFLGIVEVENFDSLAANGRVDLLDKFRIFPAAEIVTGRKKMGGIEANPETFCFFHLLHNCREVFKLIPQRSSLSGGNLQAGNRL